MQKSAQGNFSPIGQVNKWIYGQLHAKGITVSKLYFVQCIGSDSMRINYNDKLCLMKIKGSVIIQK